MDIDKRKLKLVKLRRLFRKWIDLELANFCLRAKIWFTQKKRKKQFPVLKAFLFFSSNHSLSQNCWDTFVSPCPLNVGVQHLVTEPR